MLTTLLWHDEVRPTDPVPSPTKKDKPAKKEVDAAVELIESFSCDWDPSRYEDSFQKRLRKIVKRKGKGQEIEIPDDEGDAASPVPDLMAALEQIARGGEVALSVFRDAELRYLAGGRQLGRIATVGADGTPHVVPVAWIYNAVRDTIDVGGHELERTKKFRDVARSGRAAIVIDDIADTDQWHPRGIEVRGRGEAIAMPTPLIRIHPERIVSWGLEHGRSARTV